jgi:hypothetical protein
MFTLDLIINPIVLIVAGVFGIIIGYGLAKGMLARARSTISRLEAEMLAANAETLEAQRAYVELEAHLQDQFIPVIPMKINGKEMEKFSKEKASKEKAAKEKATK